MFSLSICTGMTWDKDGDTLAIGNEKTGKFIQTFEIFYFRN